MESFVIFLLVIAFVSGAPKGTTTCGSEDDIKLECGYFGINEDQCRSRGCCWTACQDCEDPWCYLSQEMMSEECAASPEDREECGFYGIERDQCLRKNCCWQPYGVDSHEPWCFHPKAVEVPRTPGSLNKKVKAKKQWWTDVLSNSKKNGSSNLTLKYTN